MKLGVDLSILEDVKKNNVIFKYNNKIIEPFHFFSTHSGIKMVRLRLWNDPFDENHSPYGGGTNDLDTLLKLAVAAKKDGMSILLDFHYSDFWVDPSRQKLPKSWEGLSYKEVLFALEKYTRDVLIKLKENEIDVAAIQVGNEITHGMVWPFGDIEKEYSDEHGGGFKGLASLLNAGYKACKEIYPQARRICHLEHGGSFDMQDWYFSNLLKYDVDFDVIGESYYPYWHGPLTDFEHNVTNLKNKYHKDIWLVEMGYEFADSLVEGHHSEYQDDGSDEFKVGNINGKIPFPLTKEGQAQYIAKILEICYKSGVEMVFYWEPCWIGKEGWAKEAGQIYCGLKPTKADNDWENETLFDFNGNANPAVEIFNQNYVDKTFK